MARHQEKARQESKWTAAGLDGEPKALAIMDSRMGVCSPSTNLRQQIATLELPGPLYHDA